MSIIPLSQEIANAAVNSAIAPLVAQAVRGTQTAGMAGLAGAAARAAANATFPHIRASRIQRMFRRQRERRQKVHQRNRIGMNPGSSGAKKDAQLTSDLVTYNDCALNFIDVTNIDKTTTNSINGRQGNACYFSGVKMHMRVYNNYSPQSTPCRGLKFHIALVSPVRAKTVTDDGWFRDYVTSRDKNFTTTLNEIEYDDPINSDRYITHWKKSFSLGPLVRENNSATQTFQNFDQTGGSSMREMNTWIPVKRNIRFNDDTNEDCETPVFLVWWAKVMENSPGQATNSYSMSMRLVSFFHESLPKKHLVRFGN